MYTWQNLADICGIDVEQLTDGQVAPTDMANGTMSGDELIEMLRADGAI